MIFTANVAKDKAVHLIILQCILKRSVLHDSWEPLCLHKDQSMICRTSDAFWMILSYKCYKSMVFNKLLKILDKFFEHLVPVLIALV